MYCNKVMVGINADRNFVNGLINLYTLLGHVPLEEVTKTAERVIELGRGA